MLQGNMNARSLLAAFVIGYPRAYETPLSLALHALIAVFVIGCLPAFGTSNSYNKRYGPSSNILSILSVISSALASGINFKFSWGKTLETKKEIPAINVSWEPSMSHKISQEMKTTQKHSKKKTPFMVGVVGIPGSGKSTSAEILSSMLPDSIVVPMDGFHLSKAQLKQLPDATDAIYRRGAPDTFDPASLHKKLERIVDSDEPQVSIPGFDHSHADPEQNKYTFVRDEHKIVICEGIYLMHDDHGWEDIKSYFDFIIYIDASIDTCINRLKVRNKCIPGYTPEEIEKRCDAVDRVNASIVEQSRKFATQEVKSGIA